MLKALRKNTKTIVWIVILSFALWGGFSVGTQFQKKGRIAGEAFGKNISFQEFDSFYRATQIFAFSEKPSDKPEVLRNQAWQSVVLSREAKREKIQVADQEVRDEIIRILESQGIAQPTPEAYRRWLTDAIKETPQEFEKQMRELLRIQKLMRRLHQEPVLPPSHDEILDKYKKGESKLSLEMMKFATLDEAKAFAAAHKTEALWKKDTQSVSDKLISTGSVSLEDLTQQWQVAEEKAGELIHAKPGDFAGAFAADNGFVAARVLEAQPADETKLDEEATKKYTEILAGPKRMERFKEWSHELMKQARFKSYLNETED